MLELARRTFIMEEWLLNLWSNIIRRIRVANRDTHYLISNDVIDFTSHILQEYGKLTPANEGIVYWAGSLNGNKVSINCAIAPETTSSEGRVTIDPMSNFAVVKLLSEHKLSHIGQVHSHPGNWIDHSEGDNEWASFKRSGLISIVVPLYCKEGMIPISKCGVHRFENNNFIRLSDSHVNKYFMVIKEKSSLFDLRNKNNYRWT